MAACIGPKGLVLVLENTVKNWEISKLSLHISELKAQLMGR